MDFIEINRFTQEKNIKNSRDLLYGNKLDKVESLRLIIYACKKIYGINNTSRIIHALGIKEINLR